MGIVIPTFTDYSTACGELPQTFLQMLANSLVTYDGHVHLNLIVSLDNCDDLTDFWTCANQNLDPERALVENAFALDECGRLGLKVFYNQGAQ